MAEHKLIQAMDLVTKLEQRHLLALDDIESSLLPERAVASFSALSRASCDVLRQVLTLLRAHIDDEYLASARVLGDVAAAVRARTNDRPGDEQRDG
jgi:hypothetical protein